MKKYFSTKLEGFLNKSQIVIQIAVTLQNIANGLQSVALRCSMLFKTVDVHQKLIEELFAQQAQILKMLNGNSVNSNLPETDKKDKLIKPN